MSAYFYFHFEIKVVLMCLFLSVRPICFKNTCRALLLLIINKAHLTQVRLVFRARDEKVYNPFFS